jgi:hypothetical protein
MKCAEFQTRFQQVLDVRNTPACDEQLLAHAAECEECRSLLEGWEAFCSGFDTQSVPELDANFADGVVAASLVAPSSSPRSALIATLIAVAAVALLAAIPLYRLMTAEPATLAPSPEVAIVEPAAPEIKEHRVDAAEFAEMVDRITPWIPEVTPERMAPVDRLAGQFKPVTASFTVAYETLRRTIPVRRSSNNTEKKPQASSAVHLPTLG